MGKPHKKQLETKSNKRTSKVAVTSSTTAHQKSTRGSKDKRKINELNRRKIGEIDSALQFLRQEKSSFSFSLIKKKDVGNESQGVKAGESKGKEQQHQTPSSLEVPLNNVELTNKTSQQSPEVDLQNTIRDLMEKL